MQKPTKAQMKKRSNRLPLWIAIGVVVLVGGFVAFRAIQSQPAEIPYASEDEVPRITVEEAYDLVQRGEAVLVDTRSIIQYETSHAMGALHIPATESDSSLRGLDKDVWYLTYCT